MDTNPARPVTSVMRLRQAESRVDKEPKAVEASFHYVDEFLKTPQASLMVSLNLFPSTKDLVESMAVLHHAKRQFPELFNRNSGEGSGDSLILVVGDGETPRTSALFALSCPQVQVLAVDPWLRDRECQRVCNIVKNLQTVARPIQRTRIRAHWLYVVLLHAHCSLDDVLVAIVESDIKGVIVCPCCDYYEKQSLLQGLPPTMEMRDVNLCSKDNLIRTWKLQRPGTLTSQLMIRKKSTFLEKLNDLSYYCLGTGLTTEKQGFGIVSHVRKLKNWIFFDLWQPVSTSGMFLDRSLAWLSNEAAHGRLPKHRPIMEFTYNQCCLSRAAANVSNSIKPGNLVCLSDVRPGLSARHQYPLWFAGKHDLLFARLDLDCIYLDFV